VLTVRLRCGSSSRACAGTARVLGAARRYAIAAGSSRAARFRLRRTYAARRVQRVRVAVEAGSRRRVFSVRVVAR
jgi:hypothetical protein